MSRTPWTYVGLALLAVGLVASGTGAATHLEEKRCETAAFVQVLDTDAVNGSLDGYDRVAYEDLSTAERRTFREVLDAGGQALAHSAFVAIPVGVAGVLVGRSRGRTEAGLALLVGYWSHLAADVADPLRYGNGIAVERILWPFVETRPYSEDLGVARGLVYLREFVADLLSGGVSGPNLLYLLLPGIAFALWIVDGLPGVATLARAVRPR